MNRRIATWILTVVSTLLATRTVMATVNASFPNGGGVATVTPAGGDHYSVVLERTDMGSGTVEALVTGATTDVIDSILVETSNAPGTTAVTVRGSAANTPTGSLVQITKTGTGSVTLSELRLAGDLGASSSVAVALDAIGLVVIDGDVLGDIGVVTTSFNSGSAIGGNFLANLTVSNGSVTNLDVTGDIGTSTSPITITVGDDLVRLQAANVYADVEVTDAVQTFRVIGSPGELVGSFEAGRLEVVAGGTGEFFTAGQVIAPLNGYNIHGDLGVPATLNNSGVGPHIVGDVLSPVTLIGINTVLTVDGTLRSTIQRQASLFPYWCAVMEIGAMAPDSAILMECQVGGSIHVYGNMPSTARIDILNDLSPGGSCAGPARIELAHPRWTPTIDRLRPVDRRSIGWSRDRASGSTRPSSGRGRWRWC